MNSSTSVSMWQHTMHHFSSTTLSALVLAYFMLLNCSSLILACTDTTLATILPNNGYYNTGTPDHILQGHEITSLTTRNILQCAGKCTGDELCVSFNYSPDSKVCDLNSETHTTQPASLVPQIGVEYYYYDWSKFTGCNFISPNANCVQFLHPRLPHGTTRIEFSVKTISDAFVVLSPENRVVDPDPMYVIDIGGNGGADIFVRQCKGCSNAFNQAVPNLELSDQHYRRFWITWDSGLIRVGKNQDTESLVEWQDPNPLPVDVHYIGFASWYTHIGDWQLHSFCDPPWEWQTQ
ncbi:uncharacterized protein [Amphiura filiformis]|uniref:uncharacterized protein n=1 Tax=Amphiura filiformis TaxID=82378 RepID=UPI003B216BF4